MKVNIIYKFLASLILSFFIVNVVYAGNDTSENPVDKTQQFYTKYIQLYFKITPPDAPELKKLMKDNVSPSFLEKLKSPNLCRWKGSGLPHRRSESRGWLRIHYTSPGCIR